MQKSKNKGTKWSGSKRCFIFFLFLLFFASCHHPKKELDKKIDPLPKENKSLKRKSILSNEPYCNMSDCEILDFTKKNIDTLKRSFCDDVAHRMIPKTGDFEKIEVGGHFRFLQYSKSDFLDQLLIWSEKLDCQ